MWLEWSKKIISYGIKGEESIELMNKVFLLILMLCISCTQKELKNEIQSVQKSDTTSSTSLMDSIKSMSKPNQLAEFDITKLQTDDFDSMMPINASLYRKLYPKQEGFTTGNFYVYSYFQKRDLQLTRHQQFHRC